MTGKTRVLGALASCYRQTGHRIVAVAPTGRAARELGHATAAPALTLHRLVADLDRSGGFAPGTVVLLDEAGMAPTRQTAALLAYAEHAEAKLIAAGDAGQLPSAQAGGWFHAVAREQGGVHLREVMRQRDPRERAALEALHDRHPDAYLDYKQQQRAVRVHPREEDALAELLREWDQARAEHGLAGSVMIAGDNATRTLLNTQARAALKRDGTIAVAGVEIAGTEFCVGERVIARRNDRHRDIDNGTCATITKIDQLTGVLTVKPDNGGPRVLDADHIQHAYALTGHGAQGATVEWAAVVGRPTVHRRMGVHRPFTCPHPHPAARDRRTTDRTPRARSIRAVRTPPTPVQALNYTRAAMKRPEAEQLALEHIEPQELPTSTPATTLRLPLGDLAEAGAERAQDAAGDLQSDDKPARPPPPEPDWRAIQRARDSIERGLSIHR